MSQQLQMQKVNCWNCINITLKNTALSLLGFLQFLRKYEKIRQQKNGCLYYTRKIKTNYSLYTNNLHSFVSGGNLLTTEARPFLPSDNLQEESLRAFLTEIIIKIHPKCYCMGRFYDQIHSTESILRTFESNVLKQKILIVISTQTFYLNLNKCSL